MPLSQAEKQAGPAYSGFVSAFCFTRKEVVEGDMKTFKLSKEDALVCSKWRCLIKGTEEDSDDSGGVNVSDCFWYQLTQVTLIKGS